MVEWLTLVVLTLTLLVIIKYVLETKKLAEASIKQVEITRGMFDLARGKKPRPFEILKTEKSGDNVVFALRVNIDYARILSIKSNSFIPELDFELPRYLKKGHLFRIPLPINQLGHQSDISIRFYHGDFLEEGRSYLQYRDSKLWWVKDWQKA